MSKFKPHFIHASLGLLAVAAASSAPAQTLFSVTETATSGQPITVAGSGFGPSTQLILRRFNGSGGFDGPVSVPITGQTSMTLGTNIPANLPLGVYRLETSTAGIAGGSIVINAPRVSWANTTTSAAGFNVRLVGRNLYPTPNIMPAVRLVDTSTGASLPTAVKSMSSYTLTFAVPAGVVVGHNYSMVVNTGLAGGQNGSASETTAPAPLTIQAAGADPYALGVSWGSEFANIASNVINAKTDSRLSLHVVGDGVADDRPALQAAINYANQHGGGTVYLPAGNYNVDDGTSVDLLSGVVVTGDGYNTILRVGYRYDANNAPASLYPLQFRGAGSDYGLYKLTIRNANNSLTPNYVLRTFGSNITHVFMRYVTFEMGNARPVFIPQLRSSIITGCSLTSTSLSDGPFLLSATRDLYIGGNSFNWRCGRIRLNVCARDIFESNTFLVDNSLYNNNTDNAGNPTETGGIEASYSQDLLVMNNKFQGYGAGNNTKENEMFGAQRSTVPDYWSTGSVVSATGTTLVQAKDWSGSWLSNSYDPSLDRSFVAIVRGKGAGQMRRVTAHDTTSLTVDKPWDVTPDSTSIYAVGSFIALDQVFIGNTLSNMYTGVQWWDGAIDSVCANNTLTNCGSLSVRGVSESDPRATGNIAECLCWHNSFVGNSLSTTAGQVASIDVVADINYDVALQPQLGNLALDNSITNNTINGGNFFNDWYMFRYDGIAVVDNQEQLLPLDPLVNLGYNVYGNSITGSLMPYYYKL